MRLSIEHRTRLTYDHLVNYSIQELHLTPRDGFGQRVKRWEIRVNGQMHQHADAFGNTAHTLVVDTPHQEIDITAHGEVETGLDMTSDLGDMPLQVYLRATPMTAADDALRDFAAAFRMPSGAMDANTMLAMMHALKQRVLFVQDAEGSAMASEAFAAGRASGPEMAQIFAACCRVLGVPARYVSGYRFDKQGSVMHAHGWVDVWMDAAWQSFDVAYGQRANGIHVRLATGLDARDTGFFSQARNGDHPPSIQISAQSQQ